MAGEAPPSCDSVLQQCNDALEAEIKVNNLQKQIIADQDDRFAEQQKELSTEAMWKPIAIGGVTVVIVETALLVLLHK